jgi:hypothetical protein
MDKTMLELQDMTMSEENLARMTAITAPANKAVREAADARLVFDDEPAHYEGFLNAGT